VYLELDPPRLRDPSRGVQDLQRNQVAVRVVVEDDAGLVLIALAHRRVLAEDGGRR
jgi:hypothetical protein